MKKIIIVLVMSLAFTTQSNAQEESRTKDYITAGVVGAAIALGAVYIYKNKDQLVEESKELIEKGKKLILKVPTK